MGYPDWTLIILFAVLGLTFGSFGTVVISRVPPGRSLGGRSRCPRCRAILGPVDLIPLFSFLFLRGRCRRCGKPISLLYPLAEALSACLFVLALWLSGGAFSAVLLAFALWTLLLIACVDTQTRTIPDVLSFALIFFALAIGITRGHIDIAGPILLFLFFAGQWILSRGKWIGSGDLLLGIGIGFLVGDLARSLLLLALAYVLGAFVAVFLLMTKRATRKSHIPFAPFLAMAAVLVLVFGERFLSLLFGGF